MQNTNTQTLLWLVRASGPFRNLWHTWWMVTEKFPSIDGIVYRGIGGLHRTKPRQGLDMDDLVYPYDDMETLKTALFTMKA